MKLLALFLLTVALSAQQLTIEATFSKDPQRGYAHVNGEHVFRCDGERLNVKDTSTLPHPLIQAFLVNDQATFGCVFPASSGVFTCYRFTPSTDLMQTLMSGQECLKGDLQKVAAVIQPGPFEFGTPVQLGFADKPKKGDKIPAGDGCNTCTFNGEYWGCTLIHCSPFIQ